MMIWLLPLLFIAPVFSQDDFSAIQELDEELPNFTDYKATDEEVQFQRTSRQYRPPKRIIRFEEIKNSGTSYGAIPQKTVIRNIETNQNYAVHKLMYVRYFNLEDENGFKYIQNKDGSVKWKIKGEKLSSIKEELALYEPPLRYTPAPTNIVRANYDKKLSILPEVSFYTGLVQGDYIADLFDDQKAKSGVSNQYGVHVFTDWKLPVKVGAVFHFERASYKLEGGGGVIYTSPSFGPQVKSREFYIMEHPLRFQAMFRVSPFAKAEAETIYGNGSFKFNSVDFMASLERPVKNRFGEFVFGLYVQSQWLNIKDQSVPVNVRSSNETNKSYGISFAQVF